MNNKDPAIKIRSPDEISPGDLVSIKEAVELVKKGPTASRFKSPFWNSFSNEKLEFPAKACCGCDNGEGLMLVIGHRTISSNGAVKKKLLRGCPLCGNFTEELSNGKEFKSSTLKNRGGKHEGGENTP